ncbi:MAG: hypothetical protein DWI00_02920 [Planctomycetota bacterium]|nr:MAG: hypothetical protein DWI00_02920 [Planctomycetota bacterium]
MQFYIRANSETCRTFYKIAKHSDAVVDSDPRSFAIGPSEATMSIVSNSYGHIVRYHPEEFPVFRSVFTF